MTVTVPVDMMVLGVDIGGTKVAVAPVDRSGRMSAPALIEPTVSDDTAGFLAGLQGTLDRALQTFAGRRLGAIGLACAGTIDSARGVVVTSPNLPLRDMELGVRLQEVFDVPVVVENDANAAVWAESVCGAAAGYQHIVMLTLGTGIGGGLVLDGHLYRGAGGGAAELGHIVVCRDGLQCACGSRGCLEMYASGQALERYARARAGLGEEDVDDMLAHLCEQGCLDGRAVSELARQGHPGALAAVGEMAVWLGAGLVSVANIFNPQVIVVGGGASNLGDLILEPAARIMREAALRPNGEQAQVVRATLGDMAGLVGGGLTAWDFLAR